MINTVRPRHVLKNGPMGLPPDVLKFLTENTDEVKRLYAGSARSPGRRPRKRRIAALHNAGKLTRSQGVTHRKNAEICELQGIT